jgi:DNA-binding response OmpR family regulator
LRLTDPTLLTWPATRPAPPRFLYQRLDVGDRSKARLVLIEDDLAIALMYQLQLVTDGFEVELATDGATGLRKVQDAPPDLILLDLRLPGMQGMDVLRAISNDPRLVGIPVLILSNYGEPNMVKEGLQLGARDYLIKSQTTPIQLSTRLRDFLPPTD